MFNSLRNRLSRAKAIPGIGSNAMNLSPGLDFLPDGYADKRRRRRTNAVCLGLFLGVVSAIGTTFYFNEKSLASVEAEYRGVEEQYAGAARQIEQVKQMLQKRKTVADRVELAVSLRERLPRSNLLAEITNALPGGVTLTDCGLEAKRLTAAAPSGPTSFEQKLGQQQTAANAANAAPQPLAFDTTLTITGISYTEGQVSDYIDALNRSGYFASVDLRWVRKGSTVDKQDETMRTFAIAITVDPEAEARPTQAKLPTRQYAPTVGADTNTLPGDPSR